MIPRATSTPPRRGRPRRPELARRRREDILRVATKLFASSGFACTDLHDVADRLGVGKGTLYRYFPTKDALFQSAADRAMVGLRAAIDASGRGADDPLDRLGAAVRAYLRYFDRHPEFVELLMQERAQFKDRKQPTYFQHREANRGAWEAVYREMIAAGRLRDIPVDRIMDTLGMLMYGAMFTNYAVGRRKPLVTQADDILDVVFNGLLTPAERRRRENGLREEPA